MHTLLVGRRFWLDVCLLVGLLSPMLLAAQEIEQMESWFYQAALDPITDVNSSSALTKDDDEEWLLGVHCIDGGYGAAIVISSTSLRGSLLRLNTVRETWQPRMTWRIDQSEPVTENWSPVEYGLGIRNHAAANFVEALLRAKDRIVMRFGHSNATYTVILPADGAVEAIGALNACN